MFFLERRSHPALHAGARRIGRAVFAVATALTLLSAATVSGSSIHYVWEYPLPYAGSGSAYPAQAAPGATVFFRARVIERMSTWTQGSSARYQWYFNDAPIPGETGWSLTLRNVSAANSGNYSVRWTLGGFVNQRDYFPLTVVAPPATPLEATPHLVPVTSFPNASLPLAAFADGRAVLLTYPLRDGIYAGSIVIVRGDGSVEARIRPDTNGPPVPSFLPSGRYLRSTQEIDGVRALVNHPNYMLRAIEELPDGRVIVAAMSFLGTQEIVIRLNADFTLDPSFDSAANAFRARAVRYGTGFLLWQGRQLVALHADGTVDPAFAPFAVDDYWPELRDVPVDVLGLTVQPLPDGSMLVACNFPAAVPPQRKFVRLAANGSVIPGTGGTFPGANSIISDVAADFYTRDNDRNGVFRFRTSGVIGDDPTFYAGVESTTGDPWDWVHARPEGGLLAGKLTPAGMVLARLRTTQVAAPALPAVISARVDRIIPGGRVAIVPRILGSGTLQYQWVALDGGTLPPETRSPTLVFESFQARNVGQYQLRITGAGGTYLSPVYRLIPDEPVQLLALSGRGIADADPGTLIAGWAMRSGGSVLARGVGPTLGSYGVRQFATDPSLTTKYLGDYNGPGNDNWTASLSTLFERVGAAPLLAGSQDAAVEVPGHELGTLLIRNPAGRGIALAELYDTKVGYPNQIHLSALSLRGFAGTGEEALIGGFVLSDPTGLDRPLRVLMRIVGPTLGNYGVAQPIANPHLKLFDVGGAFVAQNDDWDRTSPAHTAAVEAATAQVGLVPFASGTRDAAVSLELAPGAYTVHATGADGGTGTALIEIYRVD